MACKVHGHSQAAHVHRYGQKSKGKKVCDSQVRPLCTISANDCHGKLDQYKEHDYRDEILDAPLYETWLTDKDEARELIRRFNAY